MLFPPVRVLIVDDEPLARSKIRRWLQGSAEFHIVAECGNGYDALHVLKDETVDLLFLDVQMPEMNGLSMLRQLAEDQRPVVIFVTAYDQYAIEAFEFHALDYLLKPYDQERFEKALSHCKSYFQHQQQPQLQEQLDLLLKSLEEPQRFLERFVVKTAGRAFFVKVEQVDWIEAQGNYVSLHVNTEEHLIRDSLAKLESKLDPNQFVRIHRSTMVNINQIKELYPASHSDYFVMLRSGKELLMSRNYRKKLAGRLNLAL